MRFKIGLSATGKILSLCLLLSFLSAPATCSASTEEPMFLISQSELETLSSNLMRLKELNQKSQRELQTLRSQLTESKAESLKLKARLAELTATSMRQENSLTKANQSLMQYAAEEKRTRLRIKAQRNMWEAMAGAMLIGTLASR